jgi:hypothetical protein
MHRSRLAGFIIDCKDADLGTAGAFWSAALGMPLLPAYDEYAPLDASSRDLAIEVQRVSHESRLHLDIETDDIEAEVERLEKLGARRVGQVKGWVVLESPTGQRFCVIRAKTDLASAPGTTAWP